MTNNELVYVEIPICIWICV